MIDLINKNPDDLLYPLMLVASIGELEINPETVDLKKFPPTVTESRFELQVSVFKDNKENVPFPFHLVCGVRNTRFPSALPQFNTIQVEDINGTEAREFINSMKIHFKPFKKSIIVFEPRAYKVSDFTRIMDEWKHDFLNITQKLGEKNE